MSKRRAKKQTKGKSPKKGLAWFVWLTIGLGIVAIVVIIRLVPAGGPLDSTNSGKFKAAIVDQLYNLQPNLPFIEETTQYLAHYGFEVDVYRGDDVTVDLYRNLPSFGYKLIIFRAHSGLLGKEEDSKRKVTPRTCLFTNEPYSQAKHVKQQLNEEVGMARVEEYDNPLFAIGPRLIQRSTNGEFADTVIIMMGCSCLTLYDLASAFIDKGASAYLAWDARVGLDYVDEATLNLLKNLCAKKLTVKKAVEKTMDDMGADPDYNAYLKYYPGRSGDKTIRVLIQ